MILNRINTDIDREFENKRHKARDVLEKRKAEVYKIIPAIQEIDNYMSGLGILLGYRAMNKKPSDFIIQKLPKQYLNLDEEQIKAEIKNLEVLKSGLLKSKALDENYLNNSYECKVCSDTGYISKDNGIIEMCKCRKNIYAQKLKELAGVPENHIFENFNLDYYSDSEDKNKYGISVSPRELMKCVLDRCVRFVNDFEKIDKDNMVFIGKSGLGKTFLANCIINALTDRCFSCMYVSATDLFKYFASGFYGRDDCSEIVDLILNCNLLVIDDLGSEKQTETRYAELLDILNKRESNNKNKLCKTIITTNMMPAQIKKNYDERVFSRIYGEYDLLKFAGDDVRLIKKQIGKI